MKTFYEYAAVRPTGLDVRHRDGRPCLQIRRALRAPSIAEACRRVDSWTRSSVSAYVDVEDGVPEQFAFLNDAPVGTVFVAPLDPGDTIDGKTGWRAL